MSAGPPTITPPTDITSHSGRTVVGGFTAFDICYSPTTFTKYQTFPANAELQGAAVIFTPDASQSGPYNFYVKVENEHGSAVGHWRVLVENDAPTFDTISLPNAHPLRNFQTAVNAIDPEQDTLKWFLDDKPEGATIDSSTGCITWNSPPPQWSDVGTTSNFLVRVEELTNSNKMSIQTFSTMVENQPPMLDLSNAPLGSLAPGDPVNFRLTSSDEENDPRTYSIIGPNHGATIVPVGDYEADFVWTALLGTYNFEIRVKDLDPRPGYYGQDTWTVFVDEPPPSP